MKKTINKPDFKNLIRVLGFSHIRRGPFLVVFLAFVLTALVSSSGFVNRNMNFTGFELGRVAPRDVIAERSLRYVDEEATELKRKALERQVPAVFVYDSGVKETALSAYRRFAGLVRGVFAEAVSAPLPAGRFRDAVEAEYPGAFSEETLNALFRDPVRERLLENASAVLEEVLTEGVFALPREGLENFNPLMVELFHTAASRTERENIGYERVITKEKTAVLIEKIISAGSFPSSFGGLAEGLLSPFITENVFFSAGDTEQRVGEAAGRVEPEMLTIEQGDHIIKEGAVITREDVNKLEALSTSLARNSAGIVLGRLLALTLVFFIYVFFASPRMSSRELCPREVYFLAVLTAFYILGSLLIKAMMTMTEIYPAALFVPTALAVMLPALLINSSYAAVLAVVLPFGSYMAGAFTIHSFTFAVISGFASVFAIQGASRRMDLIKAGFITAAFHIAVTAVLILLEQIHSNDYLSLLTLAAANGIVSGMLVMGCLSLLEQALNTATPFRLIELSDLNSPTLKRLLAVAPGTYSHSVMVANLAEAACQDIGANSLLARVGAYYHDIGKMDQSDYFIENQTAYNKHDDLAPRLSATIIRSHIKIGVEKARSMKLPEEVINIIGEHHGNSVITWFYNEALKRETNVNIEDFTYPGNPPRSRESAVVMLADVVEAAVRTLKKPSAGKIEKFIQELIMAKFDHGQLSESELTFRDLETIKMAFVRVLAGYYHSRIDYPKAAEIEAGENHNHALSGEQRVSKVLDPEGLNPKGLEAGALETGGAE